MTLRELETICDYLRLVRSYANKILDKAQITRLEPDFRELLIKEQSRRVRETSRLIDLLRKETGIICQDETDDPTALTQRQRAKRNGQRTWKKLKPQADGTYCTASSGKNANASRKQSARGRGDVP